MKQKSPGVDFEEAVADFAKRLDPNAEVKHNHHVPDHDTGEPRQCDVWISARFGGHWPISILVSCKDHRRKLDSGDIGTFRDEIRSTGASAGVIYSRSGFTEPALRKAKASGIACCSLYVNQTAEIPDVIRFDQYVSYPRVQLSIGLEGVPPTIATWSDLFSLNTGERTILELIAEGFREGERSSLSAAQESRKLPSAWHRDLEVSVVGYERALAVRVWGAWRVFRANRSAVLVNGSYCLTDGSFLGTITGAFIDTQSDHPGQGWEDVTEQLSGSDSERYMLLAFVADVRKALMERLGPEQIRTSQARA